jgi:very-short-patch-repair endonuclease
VRVPGATDELQRERNEVEARAIVADIRAMLADRRYDGLTMGVISLVGAQQAERIQDLLYEEIGEEAIEERRIVCGDAYAFQGDERDIMFLSLVSAPNARIQALTRRDAKQRFNVAASRARLQSRRYHSVDLDDLNPEDMRARLLSYYLNPRRISDTIDNIEGLCESPFERDVLRAILRQGFSVRPQVQVGQYRIDLVVEGVRSRLAVECDGDRWHGIERWEQDLARQQVLERAGWTFWRLRASTYYRNPAGALAPLWDQLKAMGIERSRDAAPREGPPGRGR